MKKSLNWKQLRKDSENKKVSVYLLAKKEINYRALSDMDVRNNCGNCKLSCDMIYHGKNYMQCELIGIIGDINANIDENHICNFHKFYYGKYLPK